MGIVEDLSDALAKDTLEAAQASDSDTLVDSVSEILGATSSTAQEAFLTAIRVRRAEARGREFLNSFIEKMDAKTKS